MEKKLPQTQKEEVLMYISKYGSITTLEASNKLFIMDLQSVIREIKKTHAVGYEWRHKKNHFGRPCRFKKYFLLDEPKQTIFERLMRMV